MLSLYSDDFSALRSQKEGYQSDVDRDLGGLVIEVTGGGKLADYREAPHHATALCLDVGCPLTPWTSCDIFACSCEGATAGWQPNRPDGH